MASSSKKTKYICNYFPDMKKTYNFVELSKVSRITFSAQFVDKTYHINGGMEGKMILKNTQKHRSTTTRRKVSQIQ